MPRPRARRGPTREAVLVFSGIIVCYIMTLALTDALLEANTLFELY